MWIRDTHSISLAVMRSYAVVSSNRNSRLPLGSSLLHALWLQIKCIHDLHRPVLEIEPIEGFFCGGCSLERLEGGVCSFYSLPGCVLCCRRIASSASEALVPGDCDERAEE